MFKKILTGVSVITSIVSALVVAGIPDVVNWWELTKPWVIVFFTSTLFGLIINNLDLIRRYTYPAFICFLAWTYEHRLIRGKLPYQSNVILNKHKKSYRKLFEVTQYLYDTVMVAGE